MTCLGVFQWIEKLHQTQCLTTFPITSKLKFDEIRSFVFDEHHFVIAREYFFISQTNVFHDSVVVMN